MFHKRNCWKLAATAMVAMLVAMLVVPAAMPVQAQAPMPNPCNGRCWEIIPPSGGNNGQIVWRGPTDGAEDIFAPDEFEALIKQAGYDYVVPGLSRSMFAQICVGKLMLDGVQIPYKGCQSLLPIEVSSPVTLTVTQTRSPIGNVRLLPQPGNGYRSGEAPLGR